MAPSSSEGLRPSDSPTRSLARRFAGALRSRGSLAALARTVTDERHIYRWLLRRFHHAHDRAEHLGESRFLDAELLLPGRRERVEARAPVVGRHLPRASTHPLTSIRWSAGYSDPSSMVSTSADSIWMCCAMP